MMGERQAGLCPDDAIAGPVGIAAGDDQAGIDEADRLIRTWPGDPHLHFLKGSLLAALAQYEAGEVAIARAVLIAPGYEIARNTGHPILNRDMGLLIDEARAALRAADGDAPMSSTQQLLQSFSSRQTRH